MFKGKADLIDEQGVLVATFNETCHDYGVTVATVRLKRRMRCKARNSLRSLRRISSPGHFRGGE
jgi:hypothetical protein